MKGTDVIKFIWNYLRQKHLIEEGETFFKPDSELKKIMSPEHQDRVDTFFLLNAIKHNFIN